MSIVKMNINERVQLIDAMNKIAKAINDEDIFESWLMYGVADGDSYQDFKDYADDSTFEELMDLFLRLMRFAYKEGGLYCNGVKSFSLDDEER